ncbi:MAG: hypothetical protein IT435_14450 [Phycisphaerales bacterium]|nr:hypothetical protein [Phycisphaerales bacterium]
MKLCATAALAALVLSAGAAMAAWDDTPGAMPTAAVTRTVRTSADAFLRANPQSRLYWSGGQVTTVYGAAFSQGASSQQSADAFLDGAAGVLGVPRNQLVPGSLATDNAAVRPIMPDLQTGHMKFIVHSYLQQLSGIPVHRGEVRLVVRNEAQFPLVLARSSLRELGNFRIDQTVADNPNMIGAFAAANNRIDGITDYGTPELVIWAGIGEAKVAPVLALKFTVTAGEPWDAGYAKWLFLADAKTGQIVHAENQVMDVDVSGNTSAVVTAGKKADICETEVNRPMPYMRVAIGATFVYADVNGNFTVPNAGSGAVTVNAGMRGRWFRVYNPSTDAPGLSANVTPPGPANFVFNAANTDALRRAEANAYFHSNEVRDFMLFYAPTHPTIGTQTEFRINTAVSGTCNAFYDGGSINFYNAGGGCANTAFGDVVWHEYGHHLVQTAGSGQGAYGEGYGDLIGVMVSDEPVLGYGFQNNCNAGIRTASNSLQYPCNAEIHTCGQLLSGAFWETRNELLITNPGTYRDIIASLACNSVVMHGGGDTSIDPQITIDVLTLDDNNANIGDGTPHYAEIAQGFGEHNLDAPPLQLLNFTYPTGRPANIHPSGGIAFNVQVSGLSATPQQNTGVLMVDAENDGTYVAYPMSQASANVYQANFPATICGNTIRYYVTAKTTTNVTVANPTGAPGSYYSAISAAGLTTAFTDNFQTNKGWVATVNGATAGQWQRAVPNGGGARGDPATDYDGSGMCYVTQNGAGDTDVDGGAVILTSPTMDASGGEAYLSYARWLHNSFGDNPNTDTMVVEVSNNNGSSWVNLETVGPVNEANGGWFYKTFKLSSKLALTSTMKVRFTTSDTTTTPSVVEAGVDAVKLDIVTDCGSCPADFDGSGFVDTDDYDAFVEAFELGDESADFDDSGFVDTDDFDAFVEAFEAGC